MNDSDEIAQLRAEVAALKQTVATCFAWAVSAHSYAIVAAPFHPEKDVAHFIFTGSVNQIDVSTLFSTASEEQRAMIAQTCSTLARLLQPVPQDPRSPS